MTDRPNHIPPWQDTATLAYNLSIHPNTVDNWVKSGDLPPPRRRGGKLMWKWSEVDAWMTDGGPDTPGTRSGSITDGVRSEREADRRAGH